MSEHVEVEPDQPAAVVHVVTGLLAGDARTGVDPWWRAGNDEALSDSTADEPV